MLLATLPAFAEGPAFDRPGVAFATETFAPGSFSIELGLPDLQSDRSDGQRTTLYSATTVMRLGLPGHTEVEVNAAPFNVQRVQGNGASDTTSGIGDTGLALKAALPSTITALSWALRGGIGFDSGESRFSAGATTYSLGSTVQWALDDARALVFYANVDRLRGEQTWTLSPAFNFALNDAVGAFVEIACALTDHAPDDHYAGGGLTWSPIENLQFDLSADVGLTRDSTDLQAGVGVAWFIR